MTLSMLFITDELQRTPRDFDPRGYQVMSIDIKVIGDMTADVEAPELGGAGSGVDVDKRIFARP